MKNQMKNLTTFTNSNFGSIRTLIENENILFCGSDVARVLGYNQPHKAVDRHCKNSMVRNIPHPQNNLKTIDMKFISEGDVYRLITRSKLPTAEKFESWIFDEILPSLRKTGAYIQPNREQEAIDHYFPTFSDELKLAMVKELQQKNEQLQQFYDDLLNTESLLDMNTVAKELEIGEYALFAYLRGKKIMFYNKDKINIPYERFRKEGKFKTKEVICPDGKTRSVTYATRKGLDYIRKTMRKDGLLEVAR